MTTKFCPKCRRTLDVSRFTINRARKDGLQDWCKDCLNQKMRDLYRANPQRKAAQLAKQAGYTERNKAYIANYLATHPCVDCGNTNPICLDFDHIKGKKRNNISAMVPHGFSLESIIAEIAKCEVRCANCHRIVTHERRCAHEGI